MLRINSNVKKIGCFIICILLFPVLTIAQNGLSDSLKQVLENTPIPQHSEGIRFKWPSVLWLVQVNDTGKEIIGNYLLGFPTSVQKLEAMEPDETRGRFGLNYPKEQVWIVTPKPSAKIVTLSEYYELQKLRRKFKELPLVIDDKLVADTLNVLIDINSVEMFEASSDTIRLRSSVYATRLKKQGAANE